MKLIHLASLVLVISVFLIPTCSAFILRALGKAFLESLDPVFDSYDDNDGYVLPDNYRPRVNDDGSINYDVPIYAF